MPACEHCLIEFPTREAVYGYFEEQQGGRQKVFCCIGCLGIYSLIRGEGLNVFYERRKWEETGPALSGESPDADAFAEFVRDAGPGKEIDFYIDGVRCSSCVWLNEKILMKTEGVLYARINYATNKARVRWDPGKTGLDKILGRISSIGYTPKPYSETERLAAQRGQRRDMLVRLGTAGFLSCQLMLYSAALYAGYFQGIGHRTKLAFQIISMLVTTPVVFYSGMPFIKGAAGAGRLRFNMDSLIVLGAGSAFAYSIFSMFTGGEVYFDTAAMIITLVLIGRYIEAAAKGKASETLERLCGLAPKFATRLTGPGGGIYERRQVPASSLAKGDIVEVKPGERIPLDGVVMEGESEADESVLTGESRPVLKTPGAQVAGGSTNLFGVLVVRIEKTGKDTVLAGIIKAVEDAQALKPRVQALADRVSGIFVPAILAIALGAVALHLAMGQPAGRCLMTGISVLVIACPCSLGLATPLAVLIFATMASSKGILVKNGDVIEKVPRVTHVLFDKTGTITSGKPSVKKMLAIDGSLQEDYIARLASSIEGLSEHSIGRAISKLAAPAFPVSGFRAFPGRGVEGQADGKRIIIGNMALLEENGTQPPPGRFLELADRFEREGGTVIYMAWGGKVRAMIIVSDIIRPEAAQAVKEIKAMGCRAGILSGDNNTVVQAIASQAGADTAVSGALPAAKREYIARLQGEGRKVMMAGDGINDAPALTEASVGIAMGRGTDIAMESADVVLIRNDLALVPFFIGLSRQAFAIIRQNIFWAFVYNVFAIPLAVAGLLHPITAAGAMAASSLFVVGNSLRIRNFKQKL